MIYDTEMIKDMDISDNVFDDSGEIWSFNECLSRFCSEVDDFRKATVKFYFRTLRQWRAQARVDNVSCVFDLDTTVPVKTTADYQLWERQNAFVMSMLNTNIVGGQAQTIVCTHSIDGDAHAVMQEFHAH
jgi:hypothetical protein